MNSDIKKCRKQTLNLVLNTQESIGEMKLMKNFCLCLHYSTYENIL